MFVFTPLSFVKGAEVFLSTEDSTETGRYLPVTINVNTDMNQINAVEFELDYDENLLSYTGYSDEKSLIKLWINPPYAKDGKIYMAGIIPGGISGVYSPENKEGRLDPLPLAGLVFITKKGGDAYFSFSESQILLNDGLGTPLLHEKNTKKVEIKENPNLRKLTNLSEYGEEENGGFIWAKIFIFLILILIIIFAVKKWIKLLK